MLITFADALADTLPTALQAQIDALAQQTEQEARQLLAPLPTPLRLTVRTGIHVIPETQNAGAPLEPDHVEWAVAPNADMGHLVATYLRPVLLHEFHHLARGWVLRGGPPAESFMDAVVSEGLATAFERDVTGTQPLWGSYDDEVATWVPEVLALSLTAYRAYSDWMFQHPDGRRWIGYRTGTLIVDRAIAASGISAAGLVRTPTAAILALAGLTNGALPDAA